MRFLVIGFTGMVAILAMASCKSDSGTGPCPRGTVGCPCGEGGECKPLLDGSPTTCVSGVCQDCEQGREGCACFADTTCLPGLACSESGVCAYPPNAARPPENPRCYSPCLTGLNRDDGSYLPCSADGLLEGCIGGLVCVGGSCVAEGTRPPTCRSQVDCPDFQTCIGGTCYSDCVFDSDCRVGEACYRRVCRPRCTTARSSCAEGSFCMTNDGQTGFCMPLAAPSGEPQTEVVGTFSTNRTHLEFSNVHVADTVTVTKRGPASETFTVRKVEHREYSADDVNVITDHPLHWLTMGAPGNLTSTQEYTFQLDGDGAQAQVAFGNAYNSTLDRWEGTIEISSPTLGRRLLTLSYLAKPEGQWTGRMFHFASFPDEGLDAWIADKTSQLALQNVGNAFIHRWATFKAGGISYDELKAVIDSTINETWKWPSMDKYCPDPDRACYPYDNAQGYAVYSDPLTQYPIPTGANELPITINLREDPQAGDPAQLSGKIVSGQALQYAGEPAVTLRFAQDPATCLPNALGVVVCEVADFDADIYVGGRYITRANDSNCALAAPGTFALAKIPWLIPGFEMGTEMDGSGRRYRYECRDKLLPFGSAYGDLNQSFATSNPIPDGRTRKRHLEIVDGALINAKEFVLIFRERFGSFLGNSDDAGFSSYGLMILKRNVSDLEDAAYNGSSPQDDRPAPTGVLQVGCSPDLLKTAIGTTQFPAGNVTLLNALAGALVDGQVPGAAPEPIGPTAIQKVHYFCEDTGLFDAGDLDDGNGKIERVPCPVESRVRYFVLEGMDDAAIAALNCQKPYKVGSDGVVTKGTCQATLNSWVANGNYNILLDPVWRCADASQAYCSANRNDLREGKLFFMPSESAAVFVPLRAEVADAFRYKTRFRNRQGKSVGFAPQLCIPDSDAVPYCYDPVKIEAVQERVDCAIKLYTHHLGDLTPANKVALQQYLKANFAYEQEIDAQNQIIIYDGFERMNAELLIMMGDEAYTSAFASRFDLSGSSLRTFEGALFEPGGINLSGGAGFEMYNLYQAVQYYQAALDRFYSLSPLLWDSIDALGPDDGYISKDTVVNYFDRLIRASSQKSRAWAEVAKRYQSFNRPDLARLVIERAYTSAYLESIVLSRFMLKLGAIVLPEDRPQLVQRVELAQRVYSSALLAMRDGYAAITNNPTLFGFMPDYVPFPALDEGDVNAFEKILASANAKLAVAAEKEQRAIESSRAYDTDAAVFQSELVSIRNNYENRLAQICGTFTGDDGRIYPATRKYAYLNKRVALLGDPCGLVGNGELHQAMGNIEIAGLELKSVLQSYDDVISEINIEVQRVSAQCNLIMEVADFKLATGGSKFALSQLIRATQFAMNQAKRIYDLNEKMSETKKCIVIAGTSGGSDCPIAITSAAEIGIAGAILEAAMTIGEGAVMGMEIAIDALELAEADWEIRKQCDFAKIESAARTKTLAIGLKRIELDAVKQSYLVKQAAAEMISLRNEAARVLAEQEEIEQLAIDIEAARNDPNVRIYKNDAIIAADRTFADALREAYRATKVYEYYTSQSYAHLVDLFLVRMVAFGDQSLEAYLEELANAFYEFEEQYGNPDTRVAVLSLRDDLLAIPQIGEDGRPLTEAQRLEKLRAALTDSAYLNENGYWTIPFATRFDVLSPLTRNHKIRAIEVEIVGTDVGDLIGRVYLRQSGTGVVRGLDGEKDFYGFPARTAVINPFFNGEKPFSDVVYQNQRLRDRPFVNTRWELVINQKDELANNDINLNSITDVRIYITYTDFTNL